MMRLLARLARSRSGVAAAEMALMTPLLLVLMTGTFELGNFMWNEHTLTKAVRDGARFAARQPFATFATCGSTLSGGTATDTQNIVRTAQVSGGGDPRLPNWPATGTQGVTIAVTCDGSTTTGIYNGMSGGARIVTVTATVPYTTLLSTVGFNPRGLSLSAQSQAAVTGI